MKYSNIIGIAIIIFRIMDGGVRGSLTKMEISEHFTQIFQDENNTLCFECGKKSKQWAETKHCIFLCLACAANYK